MKKIYTITSMFFLYSLILTGQQSHTILASGNSFSPAELTVNVGDEVNFNVGAFHPVLEVSEATWNTNGTTALSGGFSFPAGSGKFTPTQGGTRYYVCTNHAGEGMKGKVNVNALSAVRNSLLEKPVSISPNPYSGELLRVVFSQVPEADAIIRILDITGLTLYQINQIAVDISNTLFISLRGLSKGIYFVEVVQNNGLRFTQKLLVQ